MPNTPVQPSSTTTTQTITGDTEFYWVKQGGTLTTGDLIPNTSGAMDAAPTRQVTRTLMHNGSDYVSVGARQSAPFTIRAFLTDADAKMGDFRDSWDDGNPGPFNIFYRDGSGLKGFALVTLINPTTDPSQNEFAIEVTFEPFDVEPFAAP